MLVVMQDDFDRDSQSMKRTVFEMPSKHSTASSVHQLAGFVSGCRHPLWEGLWLIYVGF